MSTKLKPSPGLNGEILLTQYGLGPVGRIGLQLQAENGAQFIQLDPIQAGQLGLRLQLWARKAIDDAEEANPGTASDCDAPV